MAYITKAEVQAKSIKLKEINKKYGVKASFSGSNSSELKLTISAGIIDFIQNYIDVAKRPEMRFGSVDIKGLEEDLMKSKHIQVNHYYLDSRFEGKALMYLQEVYSLMCEGHYDDSDAQTDYFNCSWYNSIHIGRWNKPYELIK